jgi:hypothetical protein
MFWLLPFLFMMMMMRRRRWERWHSSPARPDPELEVQRSYIEALESRVGQLEERLDFTERLLATRTDPVSPR